MLRALIFISTFIFLFSCKREITPVTVPEIQVKVINHGDSLVGAFVLWSTTTLADAKTQVLHDQAFNDVHPSDTLTLSIKAEAGYSYDFLGASLQYRMRVQFRKKIFSPFHFNNHYIEGGDPFDYGWTQSFCFEQRSPEIITTLSDKICYFNWPADTAHLKQVLYF